MRSFDPATDRRTTVVVAVACVLIGALPLGACGSDTPPPLTGNLVDARGGHAGGFHAADGSPGDRRDASTAVPRPPANSQDDPR